jgi:capsular exopolysaccharide synthesis family protein
MIPRFSRKERAGEDFELVSRAAPSSQVTEAYRRLRTNLQFVTTASRVKSLIITSPSPREGKTTTTANLALTLAEAGKRVVVVSADLRRPQLEKYFNINGEKGLSDWLASNEKEFWEIMYDPGVPNLRVIPAGNTPSKPAELLSSDRMVDMLQVLEAHADMVLVDTPPVLAVADTAILGSLTGGSILVVQAGSTERPAAQRAKDELLRAGYTPLGVVINAVQERDTDYYYTGDYYSDKDGKEKD